MCRAAWAPACPRCVANQFKHPAATCSKATSTWRRGCHLFFAFSTISSGPPGALRSTQTWSFCHECFQWTWGRLSISHTRTPARTEIDDTHRALWGGSARLITSNCQTPQSQSTPALRVVFWVAFRGAVIRFDPGLGRKNGHRVPGTV